MTTTDAPPTTITEHCYACPECKRHLRLSVSPREARQYTGAPIRCPHDGAVVSYRGIWRATVAALLAFALGLARAVPAIAAEVYSGDIPQYTNVGGPLAPTFTNVLLVALGFVALAVAVVLVVRWAAAPDTGRPRRTRPTVTRRAETRPLAVARRIEGRE